MKLVTHEMRFARDVSSRVFYMDEGIVYEEGSPEQIFDNPEKEKTRQFIHRLKVVHFGFSENSHDFSSLSSGIEDFARKHMLSEKLLEGMLRVADELCGEIILQSLKDYGTAGVTFEYNEDKREVAFTVEYGGVQADPLSDGDNLAVVLLKQAAPEVVYRWVEGRNRVEGHLYETA